MGTSELWMAFRLKPGQPGGDFGSKAGQTGFLEEKQQDIIDNRYYI
jgi:hypothetical protein